MEEKKEYYYNGDYVTIAHEVKDNSELVIVEKDGYFDVARRESLTPKEESYYYKMELKRKEELNNITKLARKNFDTLVDKLVDEACITLRSRMKFNAMFGKNIGGGTAAWVFQVTDALDDIIKEKAKETVKDVVKL